MNLQVSKHDLSLVVNPTDFTTNFVINGNSVMTLSIDALEQLSFDIAQVLPNLLQQAGPNRPFDV